MNPMAYREAVGAVRHPKQPIRGTDCLRQPPAGDPQDRISYHRQVGYLVLSKSEGVKLKKKGRKNGVEISCSI